MLSRVIPGRNGQVSSHGLDRNRVTGRQLASIALHSTCRPHDWDERRTPFIQWERRSGQDDPFPRHPPEQVGRQGSRLGSRAVSRRAPLTRRSQWQRHAPRAAPVAPASLHRGLAGSGIRGAVGTAEPAQPVQPGARRPGRIAVCGCLPGRGRQGGPRRPARFPGRLCRPDRRRGVHGPWPHLPDLGTGRGRTAPGGGARAGAGARLHPAGARCPATCRPAQ